MLLEVPPNICLEMHSRSMVSNSIPEQQVREKRKGEASLKKQEKKKKKKDDEKRRRGNQSTLQMTRDHCLCESSQCYLKPRHSARLYYRAEQRTLMWSKQLRAHSVSI